VQINQTVESNNDYIAGFVLASLATGYPEENFAENLRTCWTNLVPEGENLAPGKAAWGPFEAQLDQWLGSPIVNFDDLRSEYIDLFDRDRALNPVHETEFGRSRAMFKTTELADISGFYRAFAVEFADDERVREMADHVSVELEFYAILLMKQAYLTSAGDEAGVAVVLDARKKFLADHLGRFAGTIAACGGVRGSAWYSAVFDWVTALVDEECARLGVTPDRAVLHANQREAEQVSCGATPALQ
jgi:nitrate reductase assembly molybdenum cofactor insertion protein NarJ